MVQFASTMAMFEWSENVNLMLAREAHIWWLRPADPKHEVLYAPHDISMTNHVVYTRPYLSDQSDTLGHKTIFSENIVHII